MMMENDLVRNTNVYPRLGDCLEGIHPHLLWIPNPFPDEGYVHKSVTVKNNSVNTSS
jgi:hypothetical protein